MNKILIFGGLGLLVTAVVVSAIHVRGNGKPHDEHEGHTQEARREGKPGEEGHGHEPSGGYETSLSLEEIEQAQCEHGISTYRCAECRYEIGVVKVSASLFRTGKDGGKALLRTEAAALRKVAVELVVTGEIQMNENATVHVSPRIPGVIEFVAVDIGAHVKQGDLLFKIDSVELGKALSEYERSRVLTDLSEKTVQREKRLFERKISSEQDLIEAQKVYEEHKTDLKAAEQALHVMGLTEEDLTALRKQPHGVQTGYLPVRSPIAGTVVEKHAVIGELVEPGKDVMLVTDLGTLWVWGDIYERDLEPLLEAKKNGSVPVEIRVRAFPRRAFVGEIDYVGATMTKKTRTVKVRAVVRNEELLLRPGMFCEARIALEDENEVLAIPSDSLLSDEGRDFVFVHWKEDYYVRRVVRQGRAFADVVEILEGLKPGETIVTRGAFVLKCDVLREKMGAGCAD